MLSAADTAVEVELFSTDMDLSLSPFYAPELIYERVFVYSR